MKLPHLYLWLDFWIISAQTSVLRMHDPERNTIEYIQMKLHFFGRRWGFSFNLYSPG